MMITVTVRTPSSKKNTQIVFFHINLLLEAIVGSDIPTKNRRQITLSYQKKTDQAIFP